MVRLCLHGYISGTVQGVSFRQSTCAEAQRLNLDGWVRNLTDGRVEVLVEGDEEPVRWLARWLEHGPAAARVTDVQLEERTLQGIAGFIVRR